MYIDYLRIFDAMLALPIMESVVSILPYIQIALSILLIIMILMQRSASGLGGAFGADSGSSTFNTRRGVEKTLFNATIIIAILFVLTTFASLFIA